MSPDDVRAPTARDPRGAPGHAASGSAPARAALAGNPSDGYGGGVLAVCVRDFAATVALTVASGARDLVVTPARAAALVGAAAARHAAATGRPTPPLRVSVHTTIPREVGLAGSSAIVIATLRALDALLGCSIATAALPAVALAAEADLGIAAGLQDRVAQAHGGLTAMTFAAGGGHTARPIDPTLLPPLFVAWDAHGRAPSGGYHAALRERWGAGDPGVRRVMRRLRDVAATAAGAVERRDAVTLGAAMDESYDLRASLGPLDPRHVALIRAAREVGLCANFAGSGGAIVGIADDPERLEALRVRVGADGGRVIAATTAAVGP